MRVPEWSAAQPKAQLIPLEPGPTGARPTDQLSTPPSVLQQTWFYCVVGLGVTGLVVIVILLVCWCLRHRLVPKFESLHLSHTVNGSARVPGARPPQLDTESSPVQPADLTTRPYVAQKGMVLVTPQLATHLSRPRAKGLLKSRRGSHTSLTLSLSPSVDSVCGSSPAQTSPGRERSDLETLARASLPMTPGQLRIRLKDQGASLFKEFWEIPMNHASKQEVPLMGIGTKNRYQTIIPNEETRVILPEVNSDPLSTYINANYIHGYEIDEKAFIATQGPMAHTVDDFWRMVWETRAPAIVMITNLMEKNKRKCEFYLPTSESQSFGVLNVRLITCEERLGYSLRRLLISNPSGEERSCWHLWYTSWPDHTTPATARQLLCLVGDTKSVSQDSEGCRQGPVVVHCSAGLGRTGCFIALCIGCEQLRREGVVDVLGIVSRMRLQRGGLVQTHEQYEFIHHSLACHHPTLTRDGLGLVDAGEVADFNGTSS